MRLFDYRGALALLALAGCGGALSGGGQTGKGGGQVGSGLGGFLGTGGVAAAGAAGGSAAGASGGATGACPRAPATNDPECHPEDMGLWSAGFPVPAVGGDCTPGVTCEIPVGLSNACDQALGLQTYVCCPVIIPTGTQSGFVPGATVDACPKPIPGQDPACALPLAPSCIEGLQCAYESAFGAGSDAGCFRCSTQRYLVRCCGGVWVLGASCPGDAGMD